MKCQFVFMHRENEFLLTRRGFLTASVIVSDMLFHWGTARFGAIAEAAEQKPTPACADKDDLTPPQTAGPFFKPRSPERKSLLEPGIEGTQIILEGHIRSTRCKPIPGALVDFWQADGNGIYDNAGFRLRGHQFADVAGRYRLETIVPGIYPGRTRHFHVRVQAPNRPVLTTQLYFPGEAENKRDAIFNPKLLVALHATTGAKAANFDFVLDLG